MHNNTVVVILRGNPESYNGRESFAAVAADETAAKQWIQDEVDHKHDNGNMYARGKSADWWLQYGSFRLITVPVH